MLIKRAADIKSSEITPESVWLRRRDFIRGAAAGVALAGLPRLSFAEDSGRRALDFTPAADLANDAFRTDEPLTPLQHVTHYNNFYEFGTQKGDPARYAGRLTTEPWTVKVTGEVERPGTYALEDLLRGIPLEERIYRLRCVEAWSMVIPWVGFPLATLLQRLRPTSRAKYVSFQTVMRRSEMRGQRSGTALIDWPYVEGLRIDEAAHPLTILAVGLYGKELPNQNGAPLRLVVPWKYGFKSVKSIVRITLQERQPRTSWNQLAPHEYGFYANVNPEVDHPRWSQARERRLPNTLFNPNFIDTVLFNGYGEQVASLYSGMDLRRYY